MDPIIKTLQDVIKGTTNFIERDNSTIEVDKLAVFGNSNNVKADQCIVIGNNNTIKGMYCSVVGNGNKVLGDGCQVRGSNNIIKGEKVTIIGKGNKIIGRKCKVVLTSFPLSPVRLPCLRPPPSTSLLDFFIMQSFNEAKACVVGTSVEPLCRKRPHQDEDEEDEEEETTKRQRIERGKRTPSKKVIYLSLSDESNEDNSDGFSTEISSGEEDKPIKKSHRPMPMIKRVPTSSEEEEDDDDDEEEEETNLEHKKELVSAMKGSRLARTSNLPKMVRFGISAYHSF